MSAAPQHLPHLLLPQLLARLAAIGELDAGFLEGALDALDEPGIEGRLADRIDPPDRGVRNAGLRAQPFAGPSAQAGGTNSPPKALARNSEAAIRISGGPLAGGAGHPPRGQEISLDEALDWLTGGKQTRTMLKETIALPRGVELTAKILSFLAADDGRLDHFFSTTGHDIETVRGEAQSPAFLEALIDYVLAEDARVIAFAEYLDTRPELVAGLKSPGQESAPGSQTSDKPPMPPRRLFTE